MQILPDCQLRVQLRLVPDPPDRTPSAIDLGPPALGLD
jgi:hypothetical protein